jgi:hypothetical protein
MSMTIVCSATGSLDIQTLKFALGIDHAIWRGMVTSL